GRIDTGERAQGRPLEVGEPANVTLVDPAARRVVDGAGQVTASTNTPFQGHELPGAVVATFLRGRATVLDGAPVEAAEAQGVRTWTCPSPSRSASGSSSGSCS